MSFETGGFDLRISVAGEVKIRELLSGVIRRSADWSPVFERIAVSFQEHMSQVFATEGGATRGGAWTELSKGYAAWKAIHYPGMPKLQASGRLAAGMTGRSGDSIRDIGPDHLTVGAAVPTPGGRWDLGLIHQFGTRDGRVPARAIIDLPDSEVTKYLAFVRDHMSWESKP